MSTSGFPQGQSAEIVAFAREAILDDRGRVFGYEVLHAGGFGLSGATADRALARMLIEADAAWLRSLSTGQPVFVKFGHALLTGGAGTLLPPSLLVIELQPGIKTDAALVDACADLAGTGYAIGVDAFDASSPAMRPLLPHIRFVKVDVTRTTPTFRADLRTQLGPHAPRFIATRVDTPEMAAEVRTAGFRLLQGRFYSMPTFETRTSLAEHQVASLRLLGQMQESDLTMEALEEIIKRDVALTFRVLRSINSSAYAVRREVSSIRQALVLLGLEQVRRWAWIWVLAGLSHGSPAPVLATALVRARFCELLAAESRDTAIGTSAFLLGLCSMLDVLLGVPMATVVADLPLPKLARAALEGQANDARRLIDCVVAWERASWTEAGRIVAPLGVAPSALPPMYRAAVEWAPALEELRASA